jgi:hypothetical protein
MPTYLPSNIIPSDRPINIITTAYQSILTVLGGDWYEYDNPSPISYAEDVQSQPSDVVEAEEDQAQPLLLDDANQGAITWTVWQHPCSQACNQIVPFVVLATGDEASDCAICVTEMCAKC